MSSLPVHDPATGLRYVANNEALYRKVLGKFAEQQANTVTEVEEALRKEDMELAQRLVHTLKGLSASMGLPQLHETAMEVDAAFKTSADVTHLLPTLKLQMDEALINIGAYLSN